MNSSARNNIRIAPIIVDIYTRIAFSLCLKIASRPVVKDEIPAIMPVSIEIANAGLAIISARIVPPAGVDLYIEFVSDVPRIKNINIVGMSPTDNLPNIVFGKIPNSCLLNKNLHSFNEIFLSPHGYCLRNQYHIAGNRQ